MRFVHVLALLCLLTIGCAPVVTSTPAAGPTTAVVSTPAVGPTTVRIAAAADLRPAFDVLLPAFEQASGHRTVVSYGSSGNFYQQLQNGAPHDVFFSADVDYAQRLADAGLTAGGATPYADGRLVLWTADPGVVAYLVHPPRDPFYATQPKTLAIANPEHAPYGRAAMAALSSPDLARLAGLKLVKGDNVAHAAQMVQSGAADVGLIALSLALSPAMQGGWYRAVDPTAYPPIRQAAVVLRTDRREASAALLAYITSPEGRALLARSGFEPPSKP